MFNIVLFLAVATGLVVLGYLVPYLQKPKLQGFPGPFLAKFTDWWRLYHTLDEHNTELELHKKYGSAVRVGPNVIILDDPKLLKTIYSTKGDFLKSDFYAVNAIVQNGYTIENIFSTRSNDWWVKYISIILRC